MTINTSLGMLPFPYVFGFHVAWASGTTITVQPGLCRDSENDVDLNLGNWGESTAANTTLNAATNGANGLDTGSLGMDTWYAVYVIGSSKNQAQPALLAAIAGDTPLLPLGYDCYRRISWLRTNSSSEFRKFYQTKSSSSDIGLGGNTRFYQWDETIGATIASSGTSTTFAEIALASGAPPQIAPAWVNVRYTPALVANTASIRPHGSTAAANLCPIYLKNSAAAQERCVTTRILPQLLNGFPALEYVVTSGDTLLLDIVGFEDTI
jgi:hypothetical protein